ncbi:Sec5 [Operophtera brumata]|uniref:Exocyst complex component 2 n=1 Tax=Operophtera brumata TaxID=104452 RepID=A0A0L7L4P7_OPEBR|nr:Sec5 [Operophtera brumata]
MLKRALKRVKGLADKETWRIEEYSDYGAITNLELNSSSLSVALEQRVEDSESGSDWQRRLLDTHSPLRCSLSSFGFPKPTQALQATKDALSSLESNIVEIYLEHKGDPLVGTIEPSMYMGRVKTDPDEVIEDARPYVYEIINNLIAVHAEVDSVCGPTSARYVQDICETVCEELARLAACSAAPTRASAFQARLEYTLLRLACAEHLTRKAERMDSIINGFKKRMELQLLCLNCNMETV